MKISKKQLGNTIVIQLEGELDAEHCPYLKRSLEKSFEESSENFVLDLQKVSFIDSTGLGVFISLMRKLNERGGLLRLSGLQDEVKSIFEITRLYRVFEICPSVAKALEEIRQHRG